MELMRSIWHAIMRAHDYIHDGLGIGDSMYYIAGFFVIVGIVAQWRLYEKAHQPGWTCLVPILNMVIFLRIVGRPASHLLLLFIPIVGQFYFLPKMWIETAESFGKTELIDRVLVVLLNGLYILNLGMSYETKYVGPVYSRAPLPPPTKLTSRPQMA